MMIKRYFVILNVLLITAAIYFGVKAFYRMGTVQLDYTPLTGESDQSASFSEDETSQPVAHYNSIIERNLFNTKEKEEIIQEEPKEEEDKELEETKLSLKLWGTVSGNSKKAYAVIEDTKERKQNLYREGDTIQNAVVKKILREELILSVNGKDESLKMEERKAGPRPAGIGQDDRPGVGPASALSPPSEAEPDSEARKIALKRAEVEEAISDVNNLMQQVRIRPHFKNGKPDGLTLTRIRPDSIFRKLGLRSGDVLTGIDGNPIESVDDALKFYNSLKTSSNVGIQLRRRGKVETIDYNIEE
jgi:general secretion pathway protein C